MIKQKTIDEEPRLIKAYSPVAIYLFGSYAWGRPNEDSDLDFAVIIEHYKKEKHYMLVDGHRALVGLRIPKDLVLYTKTEFDTYSRDVSSLSFKIKNEGKKVYAKA